LNISEIKQFLAELDTRPTKSLGQNFLHDQNIARWIVSQLELAPGDHVVEVGPGLGSLTEELVETGAQLTLIEKDGRMVSHLRKRFGDKLEIIHGDAVEFDVRALYGRGPVKLLGNLPYYASTPILANFTGALSPTDVLIVTLQLEVAERLGGSPGTKAYGAMTVRTGRRWQIETLRRLPPDIFYPVPGVDSVVRIRRRPAATLPSCDDRLFDRLVRCGFSERRKMLRKLLGEYREQWPAAAAELGVPETARGEELSVAQWERLTQLLSPAKAQSGEERFDVVDDLDRPLGVSTRREIHADGLIHRAVHILLSKPSGEIYLQKRSPWKDRNPSLWDSSASGHVDAGETYDAAATRELTEELGVRECAIEAIGKLGPTPENGHEFVAIYRGLWDGKIRPAPMEIDTGAFFPPEQIRRWIARSPEQFSPVFLACFDVLLSTLPNSHDPL